MNLTNDDVQEILRLLDASSFDELQLSTDRFKLTLRRSDSSRGGWTQETQTLERPRLAVSGATVPADATTAAAHARPPSQTQEPVAPRSQSPAAPHAPPSAAWQTQGPAVHASTPGGLIEVRPPLMGTFYRAPKPGAPPYVEVGSNVGPDTVIGIIETMKLMNSAYAGAAGVVAEICAADGQLVEQNHVLMRLRPRSS